MDEAMKADKVLCQYTLLMGGIYRQSLLNLTLELTQGNLFSNEIIDSIRLSSCSRKRDQVPGTTRRAIKTFYLCSVTLLNGDKLRAVLHFYVGVNQ